MKNKNHQNTKTTPRGIEKKNSFLESLKRCCSVISEKTHIKAWSLPDFLLKNAFVILSFVVVWTLLAFYEDGLLFRVNELSLFLYDDLYYEEMMSAPAGLLSYVACYMVQFFYNPVVGATIYVALLILVYWLTCKVFDVSHRYRLFAMLPVAALLASNTQLGYWIFYLKLPGYYYVALLGVIVSLLAAWVVKKSHLYLKPLLVAAWMYFAYPYIGVYAILSGVVMGAHSLCLAIGRRHDVKKIAISSASIVVSVVMYNVVPGSYYTDYTTVPSEEMLTAGLPASQWKSEYVPGIPEKEATVAFVSGINGKVGYPVSKVLDKFKLSVDAAFSEKAIKTAKDELFAADDINKPVNGKKYSLVFVGKDGLEYYINHVGGKVSFVPFMNDLRYPTSFGFSGFCYNGESYVLVERYSQGMSCSWYYYVAVISIKDGVITFHPEFFPQELNFEPGIEEYFIYDESGNIVDDDERPSYFICVCGTENGNPNVGFDFDPETLILKVRDDADTTESRTGAVVEREWRLSIAK